MVNGARVLLDTLLPPLCALCGLRAGPGIGLCDGCLGDLRPNRASCLRCALPLARGARLCPGCQRAPPPFTRTVAPWIYEPLLAHLVSRWKHRGQRQLTPLLGRLWLDHAGMDQVEDVCRRLEALRTEGGEPVFDLVADHTAEPGWTREDAAVSVRFSPEALFTDRLVDGDLEHDFVQVRMRHTDISGSHRLDGVIIVNGPDIRPLELPQPATIYQVAPTLLYLLGLPQDARMLALAPARGGVLAEAINENRLRRQPLSMVEAYPGTDRSTLLRSPDRPHAPDPAFAREMEKLRALGYIQ